MTAELVALGAFVVLIAGGGLATFLDRREAGRRRVRIEDALKHLFEQEYRGRRGSFASLGGALRLDDRRLMQLLARMQHQRLVVARGQEFQLTPEGERVARRSCGPIACSSATSPTRRGFHCATSTPLPNAPSTR